MPKSNIRFDFDFNKVYKRLKGENNKRFIPKSSYYYLTWTDFYHDALTKTVNYINDNLEEDSIDEDRFLAIYRTTAKYLRMSSFKNNTSNKEFNNINPISEYHEKKGMQQPDLDLTYMMRDLPSKFPSINKIIQGYSFVEAGEEAGISGRGFSKRYHTEIKKLKESYNAYRY